MKINHQMVDFHPREFALSKFVGMHDESRTDPLARLIRGGYPEVLGPKTEERRRYLTLLETAFLLQAAVRGRK